MKKYVQIEIIQGNVNLQKLIMTPRDLDLEPIKVRRTQDNTRQRPNGQNRHDPFMNRISDANAMDLISSTDLEWMSLNYRKRRAAKMSPSQRRMILVMFE
mgnify:CR=1 FL=1